MKLNEEEILKVYNLDLVFHQPSRTIHALNKVSFSLKKGEIYGLVGESGCGKSVTALTIVGLTPCPPGEIREGEILFKINNSTVDTLKLKTSSRKFREIRGKHISYIFQEPMSALHPMFTVGDQIIEGLITHEDINRTQAKERTIDLLKKVGLPNAKNLIDQYPHQFSGGMLQRATIALAISCNPKLLIADEPTTALDVTIQAQILELLLRLQNDLGMSIQIITHDLGVIAQMSDRIGVMYLGQIVEENLPKDLFNSPKHPYTQGLLKSIPSIETKPKTKLSSLPGNVKPQLSFPEGCVFVERCNKAMSQCKKNEPPKVKLTDKNFVKCWLYN